MRGSGSCRGIAAKYSVKEHVRALIYERRASIYFLKVLTFCLVLRRGAGSMYCDVDGGPGAVATGPVAEDGTDLNISETAH